MKMQVPYTNHSGLSVQAVLWPRNSTYGTLPQLGVGTTHEGKCAWDWDFVPVTFDFVAMTLTLGNLLALLYPR